MSEVVGGSPLCFVLMPFGTKSDPAGGWPIDFEALWEKGLEPGIRDAGIEPVRADLEQIGGVIHRAMFERLLLCDFALADLTTANANVFYELGVRHAAVPATTLPIIAARHRIPFDVHAVHVLPYELGRRNAVTDEVAGLLRSSVASRLRELRQLAGSTDASDSPLFELVRDWRPPRLVRDRTDAFWREVRYNDNIKNQLAQVRRSVRNGGGDAAALDRTDALLQGLTMDAVEIGVLVDLLCTYRALGAWDRMVTLVGEFPAVARRQVQVREQLAFALNRRAERDDRTPEDCAADRDEAVRILEAVLADQGPSPETLGLLGRVYKSQWQAARGPVKDVYLDKAIAAYVAGVRADLRDIYPGINAVTLLDVKADEDSLALQRDLIGVVRFAAYERLRGRTPDYWDHATVLEVAVLDDDPQQASRALAESLVAQPDRWMSQSTADNLRTIRQARSARGAQMDWLDEIIDALDAAPTT